MSLKHILHVDWTSEHWRRMCGMKLRIATAGKAARMAKRRHQRAYACPYCGGHHLTSKDAT